MTQAHSNAARAADQKTGIGWEEWLRLQAAATASPPADDGPGEMTVVVTTDLPSDHPELDSLRKADKIVIEIDTFTDGRVFGLARLLRDKVGFDGELEVSGDFLPDQISFLRRCGVNSFSGEEIVRDAFNYYSGFYQPPRQGIDEVTFIRESRVAAD